MKKYYRIEEMIKLANIYGEVKKMKMDQENSPNLTIFIKYKEENMKRALTGMIRKDSRITTVENRRIDMTEGVGEESM